jgi:hypothetical protein
MNISKLGPAGRNIVAILNEDYSSLSSAYGSRPQQTSKCVDQSTAIEEYINGIDLEQPATGFQARLQAYGDQPMSTFSILA